MSVTYSEAIDGAFALFRNAWIAGAGNIIVAPDEFILEPRYMRVENAQDLPSPGKYWTRLSYTSQGEDHAAVGNRLFAGEILFSQQIFCPKISKGVLNKGRALAELGKNAIRGKGIMNGAAFFRRVEINELPPDNNWVQFVAQGYLYYHDEIAA